MKQMLKYAEVKEKFNAMLQNGMSAEEIEKELICMIDDNPSDSLKYKKAFFAVIKDIDLDLAIQYGEKVLKEEQDPAFMKVLAVRYKRDGNNTKYNAFMMQKIPLATLKKELDLFIKDKAAFDIIKGYIYNMIEKYPDLELSIHKIVFSKLKDAYTTEAVEYGEKVLLKERDPKFMKVLASRYKKIGDFEKYTALMSSI